MRNDYEVRNINGFTPSEIERMYAPQGPVRPNPTPESRRADDGTDPYTYNRESPFLTDYWNKIFNNEEKTVTFTEHGIGLVDVKIERPVKATCTLSLMGCKEAMDHSKLAGIDIQIAIWCETIREYTRKGTDWTLWRGISERWYDDGVKISTDGGMTWVKLNFDTWQAAQERTRQLIDNAMMRTAYDVMTETCEQAKAAAGTQSAQETKGLSDIDVTKLQLMGGNRWQKNDLDRLYFNSLTVDQGQAKAFIDVRTAETHVYNASPDLARRLTEELDKRMKALTDDSLWR